MVWNLTPADASATSAVLTERCEAQNSHWDPDELCIPQSTELK